MLCMNHVEIQIQISPSQEDMCPDYTMDTRWYQRILILLGVMTLRLCKSMSVVLSDIYSIRRGEMTWSLELALKYFSKIKGKEKRRRKGEKNKGSKEKKNRKWRNDSIEWMKKLSLNKLRKAPGMKPAARYSVDASFLSPWQAHTTVLNSESSEYLPGQLCLHLLETPGYFNDAPLPLCLLHKIRMEGIQFNFCFLMKPEKEIFHYSSTMKRQPKPKW